MNVNLQEHQRSILAVMGIDLWIPRTEVETRPFENGLYRDVAVATDILIPQIEFSQTAEVLNKTSNQPRKPVERSHSSIDHSNKAVHAEVALLKINPETQQTEEVTNSAQILQQTELSAQPVLQIEAFELQAYCIKNCVILVDSTHIDAEQLTLWSNIQRAVSGQYYELKWPFPLLQLQDGKGANIYIQGFVDALKQDRKVISLGELTYLKSTDIIQLASLQKMLDQPVLKRRLWQFMQNADFTQH